VRETGTTALVVSHDPASAAIADRVVTISDGRTVDERLPGEPTALVVSRGWIRVPESDLRALGRPSRLAVERHPRGLALSGVHDSPEGGGPATVSRTEAVPSGAPHDDPDPPLVAELRGVGKRYAAGTSARVVLDDTSASFRGGRLVAVVGRSGTGKTTLLRLLAGLERPNAGDVLLLGNSLAARTRSQLAALRREHVALVAQEPGLVPYLSASENLRLNLRLRDLPPSDEAIEEALAAVGLDSRLGNRADTLSAGERQRVAIARALASRRDLVLADEPTARLDRENGNVVGALLRGAADEHGCAVVCATHDPELIELADEVIALPGITDSRPQRAPSGA
jgi:putative ABC transport system ATP-binding protein